MLLRRDAPQTAKAISDYFDQSQQTARQAQQAEQAMTLQKYLKGSVGADGKYNPGTEVLGKNSEAQSQSQLDQAGSDRRFQQVQDVVNGAAAKGKKVSASQGKDSASYSENQVDPTARLFAQQKEQTHQENQYAKGLEKYSDVHGALTDLERITNRDGKGGVLTNPTASLVSSGKVVSALPDSALGLAELTRMAPAGTAEERKALARVKLSLGHAMTGARMNPTMQKMIQDSLGGIASGDAQLMTKGLRGAAGIVGSQVNTVQSGYGQPVRESVHDRLGSDPMEFYRSIVKDAPVGATAPQGPQAPQAPQGTMSFEDWKKANDR